MLTECLVERYRRKIRDRVGTGVHVTLSLDRYDDGGSLGGYVEELINENCEERYHAGGAFCIYELDAPRF